MRARYDKSRTQRINRSPPPPPSASLCSLFFFSRAFFRVKKCRLRTVFFLIFSYFLFLSFHYNIHTRFTVWLVGNLGLNLIWLENSPRYSVYSDPREWRKSIQGKILGPNRKTLFNIQVKFGYSWKYPLLSSEAQGQSSVQESTWLFYIFHHWTTDRRSRLMAERHLEDSDLAEDRLVSEPSDNRHGPVSRA